MTKNEWAELWSVLLASWPTERMDPRRSILSGAAYYEALEDIPGHQVGAAIARLRRTLDRLPSIARIREAVYETHTGPRRHGGDGWGDYLRAVSRYGVNRMPVFDDPIVAEVVRQLGWVALCNSEDQTADRARFIQLYDQIAARRRQEAMRLPGAAPLDEKRTERIAETCHENQAKTLGELLQTHGSPRADPTPGNQTSDRPPNETRQGQLFDVLEEPRRRSRYGE